MCELLSALNVRDLFLFMCSALKSFSWFMRIDVILILFSLCNLVYRSFNTPMAYDNSTDIYRISSYRSFVAMIALELH